MPGEQIGFLGLGIMGSRMAANVAAAGYPLSVWTHTPGKAERWAADHGASACATPGEVAAAAEIVVSMVVDGEQVASVLTGEQGVLSGAAAGSGVHGHVHDRGPGDAGDRGRAGRRRRGAARRTRHRLLPAGRGRDPDDHGGRFQGGLRARETADRPLAVVRVGELGQGQSLKLINNSLGAANAAALAEALLAADAAGIDLGVLTEVVMAGSGASVQLELKGRAMREHDYTTLFKTAHMLKDVRLCLEEAEEAGVPFPAADHAREVLTAAVGRGHGEDDYAALIEAIEGFAGRSLK